MIKHDLSKMLFIDIETAGLEKDFNSLSEKQPRVADVFLKSIDWFGERFRDLNGLTDPHEVFAKKSALIPEFSRIVCFSFGLMKDGEFVVNSYYGQNESDILKKAKKVLERATELDLFLIGHNIEKFDVPYLATRMVINSIEPPKILPDESVKPWETKLIDTKKIWQRNNYSALSSLELICSVLDIDSPKEGDVTGANLHENFWYKNNLTEIKEYCEKDVKALFDIVSKLKSLK